MRMRRCIVEKETIYDGWVSTSMNALLYEVLIAYEMFIAYAYSMNESEMQNLKLKVWIG